MKPTLNVPIGDRWLSAWLVAPGVVWVQSCSPLFTRKLSQRRDGRLVVRGVSGGYLRTFEFHRGLAWAQRLIVRYQTKNETPTNARINTVKCPLQRQNTAARCLGV